MNRSPENLSSSQNPVLAVSHLHKVIKPTVILDDISFSIFAGERVGVLGHNGAGKTTLLRCLSGYYRIDGGQIRSSFSNADTGYLPEKNPLYSHLTVTEHLELGCRLNSISSATIHATIAEALRSFDLEPEQHRDVGTLSKGTQQRLGLALAMVGAPKLLLLDEPTTGLDPAQVVGLRTKLQSLATDQTLIVSSHQLHEITQICTRVLIIHSGRVVLDTPVDRQDVEALFLRLTGT